MTSATKGTEIANGCFVCAPNCPEIMRRHALSGAVARLDGNEGGAILELGRQGFVPRNILARPIVRGNLCNHQSMNGTPSAGEGMCFIK